MNRVKSCSIVWVALSILLLGLSVEQGVTQGGFPFFVRPQWSHDSRQIAVVEGTSILLYDAASGAVLERLEGHADTILDVAWSPADERLASASSDQTVKIWDGNTGGLIHNLTGHNDAISQVIWSPDSTLLISADRESSPNLFMWNSETGTLELSTQAGTIYDAAFSPDGEILAVSYTVALALLDGQTLQRIIRQPQATCCTNRMESLAWSPDGSQIVTGSIDGLITIWDAVTLTQINQFPANVSYNEDASVIPDLSLTFVRDVAFGTDGTIQAVSGDGTVRQWTLDGRLLQEVQIGRLNTAAWSPYGAQLAVQRSESQALATAQNESLSSSASTFTVLTPFASLDRLQAIADMCGVPLTVEQQMVTAIAAADMTSVIAQVESLPAGAIPAACAADLLAVARELD